MLNRKKKNLELVNLQKSLSATNFYSIVSIRVEHTDEFFNFQDELYKNGFLLQKLKKNYHSPLLGKQTKKMLIKLSGTNYVVVPIDQKILNITDYLRCLETFSNECVHVYSFFSPFFCSLEKLQRICFIREKQGLQVQTVHAVGFVYSNFLFLTKNFLFLSLLHLISKARNAASLA